jgi:hypothetical protein
MISWILKKGVGRGWCGGGQDRKIDQFKWEVEFARLRCEAGSRESMEEKVKGRGR